MKYYTKALLSLCICLLMAGCSTIEDSKGHFKVGAPYKVKGTTYYPHEQYAQEEIGIASWYGPGFHGKKTANGETYNQNALTAAHRTLQLPSLVRVTNLSNGRSVIVRVTDRGPFHGNRIIDLSKRAAELLDFIHQGTAKVRVQVLGPESKALAKASQAGLDTRGAEIALNKTGILDPKWAHFYPGGAYDSTAPYPPALPSMRLAQIQKPVFDLSTPEAQIAENDVPIYPVATPNIYVEAGSYTTNAGARAALAKISSFGPSRLITDNIGGQPLYRVRVGPLDSVNAADALVGTLQAHGAQAAIVLLSH